MAGNLGYTTARRHVARTAARATGNVPSCRRGSLCVSCGASSTGPSPCVRHLNRPAARRRPGPDLLRSQPADLPPRRQGRPVSCRFGWCAPGACCSSRVQALKVAAYAATPYWVFGVCAIIPPLTLVGRVLALYSIYLLWRGLAVVMKSPKDKVAAYTLVIAMAGVIITLFVRAIPYIFI